MSIKTVTNKQVLVNQEIQLDHIHSQQKTIPTLADSIILTGGVAAWTLGSKTQVVATNHITKEFDIHYIGLGTVSEASTVYEIQFFAGEVGQEVLIGTIRAFRQSNQAGTSPIPMMTPKLPAGTRISAACATGNGGSDTIAIAIFYHEY
jgi:hypothetical protein